MRIDDRIARPREHLVDPLVQVGLHVVERAGVLVDDRLDLRDGLLVVGVRVDGDPVLAEVHAGDLVRQEGLPDVGAHVLDAGDGLQVALGTFDDARLLREGRARLRDEVPEEVALLERGNQRLAQGRHDRGARQNGQDDERGRRAGAGG